VEKGNFVPYLPCTAIYVFEAHVEIQFFLKSRNTKISWYVTWNKHRDILLEKRLDVMCI
jgi:hypothetical protein